MRTIVIEEQKKLQTKNKMFSELINTLTLKRWLAIGAIVAIAVVSGYYILSSSTSADKGSLGAFGAAAPAASPFQRIGDKNANANENQNQNTNIGLFYTAQPAATVIPFPSENDQYIDVLKFSLRSLVAHSNPIKNITIQKKGSLDESNLQFVIANSTNNTESQAASQLTLDTKNINLNAGVNDFVVKVKAKDGFDAQSAKDKAISLTIDESAFELNKGFSIITNPADGAKFPLASASFDTKVIVTPEAVAPPPPPETHKGGETPSDPARNDCTAANPCDQNFTILDSIQSRALPINGAETGVFGFSITPTQNISLKKLTISLSDAVDKPLDAQYINASLWSSTGAERIVKKLTPLNTPSNGKFIFQTKTNLTEMTKGTDTMFVVKVKILEGAPSGNNFKFVINNSSEIDIGDANSARIPANGLAGNLMSTVAAQETPPTPDAPQVCSEATPCRHSITISDVESATITPSNVDETPVFKFSAEPSPGAQLNGLKISLDDTAQEPHADAARLSADLFYINPANLEQPEQHAAGPVSIANGKFTFSQFSTTLSAEVPTEFIVKAKVATDPKVYVQQNFKFAINAAADVTFNMGHTANIAAALVGNEMHIQQDSCAAGQHLDGNSCVLDGETVLPEHDLCPNIAGAQSNIPDGYSVDAQSQCVVAVDLCPNGPDGIQQVIPQGMSLNANGECVDVGQQAQGAGAQQQDQQQGDEQSPPPTFECSNYDLFTYDGPASASISQGACIPCETKLYISSNGSCKDTTAAAGNNSQSSDQTAGNSAGNSQHSAAFETAANNQVASGGSLDLQQSQRLTRMPERGNTGPDILIYLFGGGFAPAVAYGLRKLRK